MPTPIDTIFMIDDSDDEAYLSAEFFRRQRVGPALQHRFVFTSLDELQAATADGQAFDPLRSIVVVDLNLRSKRGTDVLRAMRADPASDQLIAGICTGSQDPADARDAIEAGADFCISKPLDRAALEKLCEGDDRLRTVSQSDEPLHIERIDS